MKIVLTIMTLLVALTGCGGSKDDCTYLEDGMDCNSSLSDIKADTAMNQLPDGVTKDKINDLLQTLTRGAPDSTEQDVINTLVQLDSIKGTPGYTETARNMVKDILYPIIVIGDAGEHVAAIDALTAEFALTNYTPAQLQTAGVMLHQVLTEETSCRLMRGDITPVDSCKELTYQRALELTQSCSAELDSDIVDYVDNYVD